MPVTNGQDLITSETFARQPENTPVARGLRILELIAGESRGWTISELSEKLEISKSTISYLLKILIACDYVRQDKRYHALGPRFLDLVRLTTGEPSLEMELREAARAHLQRIVDETRLGANLGILDQTTAVYIDRVEPPQPSKPGLIKIDIKPGLRIAPHVTAIGKALICYLDPNRIKEIWDKHNDYKGAPKTITSLKSLRSELEITRERRYATDIGEHDPNVRCVAAPVFAADELVVAAISVNGTPELLNDRNLERVARIVRREADSLSEYLKNRRANLTDS